MLEVDISVSPSSEDSTGICRLSWTCCRTSRIRPGSELDDLPGVKCCFNRRRIRPVPTSPTSELEHAVFDTSLGLGLRLRYRTRSCGVEAALDAAQIGRARLPGRILKFYNTVHDSLHIPVESSLLGDTGYVDL